ncbi:hypothetical protein ACQPYK_35565 [Streptosporangium sp. CA-135522]|uniref:hypothetical protein n=1 Tax=Streptosporangium sp. CA-135522 TaxID=3240072 RepID=UPI003D92129F
MTAGVAAVMTAGAAWPPPAAGDDQEVHLSPYRVMPGQNVEIALECDGPALAESAAFQDPVELDAGPGFQGGAGFEEDGSEGFGGGFDDGSGGFGDGPGDGFDDGSGGFGDGPEGGFDDGPAIALGWAQVDYDAPRGPYGVEVECQGDGGTRYGEIFVVDGFGPDTGGGALALAKDAAAHDAPGARGAAPGAVTDWAIGAAAVLAGAGGLMLIRRLRAAGRG